MKIKTQWVGVQTVLQIEKHRQQLYNDISVQTSTYGGILCSIFICTLISVEWIGVCFLTELFRIVTRMDFSAPASGR